MFGDFPDRLRRLDSFSQEYSDTVNDFLQAIRGKPYSLADEGLQISLENMLRWGFPYSSRSAQVVGAYLMSYGYVIRAMNLPASARILEIGCGLGSLSIHMAKMGYDLTCVDINPQFIELVRKMTEDVPGRVTCIQSDMNSLNFSAEFDAVLFYESFHHSYDHRKTVEKVLKFLKPDGILVFAAEPIVAQQSEVMPFPWGPRLDAETLRAIRQFGWMEIGFTEEYFYELMRKFGLACRRFSSRETHWADLIIARAPRELAVDDTVNFTVNGNGIPMLSAGWSIQEEFGTWSDSHSCRLTGRLTMNKSHSDQKTVGVGFELLPFLSDKSPRLEVHVFCNGVQIDNWVFKRRDLSKLFMFKNGWTKRTVQVPVSLIERHDSVMALEFKVLNPRSPKELNISLDTRQLGFALKTLRITG
jgi:SAM-dependent methyltransferase